MTINVQSARLASMRLYEAETSPELVAERYGLAVADVIDFSLNVNPLGSPPGAIAAAQQALATTNVYPDLNFGILRSALARRHGIAENCFFFGAGLDDVIKLVLQAWVSEGDKVLVHLPTFPRYELEARLRGCDVVCVESETPTQIDVARIEQALASGGIALAFICTPNNPTGATVTNADIERLARAWPETIFVVDEALIYPLEEGAIPLCTTLSNLCVMRTFSKYFGLAGLRIGYAVADARLMKVAEVGRPPFNMAVAAMHAATAALDDETFLPSCKALFREETDYFRERLSALPAISICGANANMLLLDLGERNAAETTEWLARKGIVVADATSFRGLERYNMLRVSLRSREDNLKLIAALATM
ncbi:histidinol-phosphate aminotransferase/threonine-phosphate decarboxylase [Mesorhizobium sp. J18]|uniref:pyridoxal phosphate-dependent aminotransferase n=1 Tax=Mesorhizobium sp. J18 TaxID=935263 RepID=UPI00119B43F8|nr:histidinol-phosphate transaminase [Mesorhizobium sp. J18]TWG92361.1 histidinol-phosphate aminotransferase/threonine-phosphate decarboxylase [Mesorhizobium sp. J18]